MTLTRRSDQEVLTRDAINERRRAVEAATQRVMFRVSALYGLSQQSIPMPLNDSEAIDSGQMCVTLDPDADSAANVGMIDYKSLAIDVRYGVQIVFPGLYELVTSDRHDPTLLNPVRAIATDHCTVEPDFSAFRALGCLEFLPGSIWAGAGGG
jgi:hypothetical protein